MTRHLLAHYGLDRPFLESVAHLKQTSFALSHSVSIDERLAGTLARLGNSIFWKQMGQLDKFGVRVLDTYVSYYLVYYLVYVNKIFVYVNLELFGGVKLLVITLLACRALDCRICSNGFWPCQEAPSLLNHMPLRWCNPSFLCADLFKRFLAMSRSSFAAESLSLIHI